MKTFAYFGDGVYAEFDGSALILRANGHDREHGATDEIVVDLAMLDIIQKWVENGAPDHVTGMAFGQQTSA